ncbi:tonsoku-like protein [Latimeria chalumnae]|uniref:tonsoku-like protein n=1 Tax=Latimeria chalumnae TaxID=7897 RepID=UPI00313C2AD5
MSSSKEFKKLQKARSKAQNNNSLKEEAALCNQLGEILAKNGKFREAIEEHRQELQLSETLGDVIGCAVANRKIGECFAELGNYGVALKHQRRHLELARSVSNVIEEQRAWATIGRTYLFISESNQSGEPLEQAENAFMKSLAIVDEQLEGKVSSQELSEMRARLYLNLGFVYDSVKDPAKCSYYIRKSVFIAEKNKLHEDLYRANFNLGSIHFRNGEQSKAIRCLEAAKESARKMKEKHMESDCFSSIGQVLLNLGDFVAAKRSLKKAYALGSQRQSEQEIVRKHLKYAIKGSHLEEALAELPESNTQGILGISEQLGDLCCKVCCYQKAVEYYNKQLKCAEAAKRPERELAVIHVSLATTFGDLKDYKQVVKHYRAELGLRRGNPTEECKTWLNIALTQEEDGQSYEQMEQSYQNALRCAKQAKQPKLQRRVLKSLCSVQRKFGCPESESLLMQIRELSCALGCSSDNDSSEEEEEELEHSEPLEESDLELSESDEDDLEGYEKAVPGRRKTSRWNRKNEKGETALHRACIEGNLKQAQYLVEKGHPVNPRDYCGWTPLHEACNHGHLEIVQLLLDHGVNINDPGGSKCEGITPLHDALNCGNFEVAELLINKGALVTLRNTKGKTPLDSLQDWIEMYSSHLDQETRQKCRKTERLLKAVASGKAFQRPRTAQGLQDSELFEAESSQPPTQQRCPSGGSRFLSSEQGNRRCQQDSGGPPRRVQSPPWTSPSQRTGHSGAAAYERDDPLAAGSQSLPRSHLYESGSREETSSEEEWDELMSPGRPVKKRQRFKGQRSHLWTETPETLVPASCEDSDLGVPMVEEAVGLETPAAGRAAYQQAMQSLGSAKSRLAKQALAKSPSSPSEPRGQSALIPEHEYLQDDWLEDDLAEGRPKKRARAESRDCGLEDYGGENSDDDIPLAVLSTTRRGRSLNKKSSRQTRLTQIVDRVVVGRTKGMSQPAASATYQEGNSMTCLASTGTDLLSTETLASMQQNHLPPPIRVRVRVQDNVFLIPVPHRDGESHTVSWLAEQASQRYYQTCGLRPRLTLKKEGALLAAHDLVLHVLQSNEEVLAEVSSWDLPPLSNRYKRACQSLGLAEHSLIVKATELQESSPVFSLCNLSLRKPALLPILRALKLQTTTHHLDLSGNCIGDDVMEEVLATVSTTPNLTCLNLSSNRITHEGLRKLCDLTGVVAACTFKSLETLDLSLNPLGDTSTQYLASILQSAPVLSTLRLQGCSFSSKFLQHYRLLLADTMKRVVHLKTLSLSHNALGSTGVELILNTIQHDVVSQLELASVAGSHGNRVFMEPIVRYLSQEGCCLTHLNLSGNHLTDEAVQDLARCVSVCPGLESLDLSGNPGISTAGLEMLLLALRDRKSGLKYLNLAGCLIHGPLDSPTVDGIVEYLQDLRLCSSYLNKHDKECVTEAGRDLRTLTRHHKCFVKVCEN